MTDRDDLFMLFFLSFGVVAVVFVASHNSTYYDPRWLQAAFLGVIMICCLYCAAWVWEVKENLKKLYRLLVNEEELVRPGLRGAVRYLRTRLGEVWRWGNNR